MVAAPYRGCFLPDGLHGRRAPPRLV